MTTPSNTLAVTKPCRLYAQGNCRYGAGCKFKHDLNSQNASGPRANDRDLRRPPSQLTHTDSGGSPFPLSPNPSHLTLGGPSKPPGSTEPVRRKRGEMPCYAWRAGTCSKGAKCWYGHDPEVQEAERRRRAQVAERTRQHTLRAASLAEKEERRLAEESVTAEREQAGRAQPVEQESARKQFEAEQEVTRKTHEAEQEAARRVREAAQEAARRVLEAKQATRLAETARQDAAKTIQTAILGSIVTFGAGLDIRSLITGFESCTIHIKELPVSAHRDDVSALFTQQGVDAGRFQIIAIRRMPDGKQDAEVIADADCGRTLATWLEASDFQDKKLTFDVGAYNSPGGMGASAARDVDVLTISWRGPSVAYVAEYMDAPQASRTIRELDRRMCCGRRVKVMINTPPRPGRFFADYLPNSSLKIMNLPVTVGDNDVLNFADALSVRRLKEASYDTETGLQLLRIQVEGLSPGNLRSFEQSSTGDGPDGVVSVRARFSSWEEAQKVHAALADKRYYFLGNAPMWLRLPSPMFYTITIPAAQYRAQKPQWDALVDSIKDKAACYLFVTERGGMVHMRLTGSIKQAVGALKVRVENLAGGEKVEGWHQIFALQGGPFASTVHEATGAFVRVDPRKQVLKAYGEPGAIERARAFVRAEIDRLSSLEYTFTLQQRSIGFFMRHGVSALKETFGEDSVQFIPATRKITVTGGEEARHHLHRLIDESLTAGLGALPKPDAGDITCPVCYDNVSSPVKLGCGHSYCTACLRHFLVSAVDSDQYPVVCMGDESRCHIPIPIPTISKFLPTASFDRLLETVFISYVAKRPQELKYCTTPDCTQVYRATGPDSAAALQCPSCFSTMCSSCGEEAHEGVTCEEQKHLKSDDHLSDLWIAQQGGRVKKCPACSVPIEKIDGCNHMACRCGAHICWRCMGIFAADTIYPHMHSAHGGIRDDDNPNPVPVADFEEQRLLLRQIEERQRQAQRAREIYQMHNYRPATDHVEQDFIIRQINEAQRLQRTREQQRAREQQLERERTREADVRARQQEWERQRVQRQQQDGGWCTIM